MKAPDPMQGKHQREGKWFGSSQGPGTSVQRLQARPRGAAVIGRAPQRLLVALRAEPAHPSPHRCHWDHAVQGDAKGWWPRSRWLLWQLLNLGLHIPKPTVLRPGAVVAKAAAVLPTLRSVKALIPRGHGLRGSSLSPSSAGS